MNNEKLSDHHAYVLREHLKLARGAFALVSEDFSKHDTVFATEHVMFAFDVYTAFENSIARVLSEREKGSTNFNDWTPKGTKPFELRGYLLEEAVTTGILMGWKRGIEKAPLNTHLASRFTPDNYYQSLTLKGNWNYSQITGCASLLVESLRATEAMKGLKSIRERYPLNY